MQDVNNDMDDLLRQAAENYPLKTGGADWDKVSAGLQDATPVAATTDSKSKRKKRALWLLLFLPFASLYLLMQHRFETRNSSSATTKSTNQNKIITDQKNTTASTTQQANGSLKNSDDNLKSRSIYSVQKMSKNKTEDLGSGATVSIQKKNSSQPVNSHDFLINEQNKTVDKAELKNDKQHNESVLNNSTNTTLEKQPNNAMQRSLNATANQNETDTTEQKKAIATNALNAKKDDSTETKIKDTKEDKNKSKPLQTQWQRGFYAGAMASFDLSTVKFQRINKPGYSFDFLFGYRASKRFSVESGISFSKKNYYSDGKYFDKKKTGIPAPVKIYFTNGDCKMLEIPLNVKYDFALHKKSNLFATAGLSSYFMKKENYGYHAIWNTWVYDTTKHYTNSGSNILSVANFSIGYQLHVNKASSLRIEPYVKVPLKGIGIANMPIMSAGVSVGFTRSF